MYYFNFSNVHEHLNRSYSDDAGLWYYDTASKQFLVWEGTKDECPEILMPYEEDLAPFGMILDELDRIVEVDYGRYHKGVMNRIRNLGLTDEFYAAKNIILDAGIRNWIEVHH